MTDTLIIASKKRLLLAAYVDFLLFVVAWGLANFLAGGGAHFVAGVIVFVVIELMTWKLRASPGKYFLSIGRERLVDPIIYERENWLTMLLGIVFVLEGSKLLVNWTRGITPEPFFGVLPGDTAKVTIDMLSGVLMVLIGFMYLKLRRVGFWLALMVAVTALMSIAMSWSLWVESVPAIVMAGRAAQGRVASPSELQFMQLFLPYMEVAVMLVVLIAVLASYRRFFRQGSKLDAS